MKNLLAPIVSPRPPTQAPPVIEARELFKVYPMGRNMVEALRSVSFTIQAGEMVAVIGASGSGKSTLMNILGCLDRPTSGTYLLDGVHVESLKKNELAAIRNQKIGFVFQGFNLLARTSALANVELPMLYDRTRRYPSPRKLAREALDRVGLGDRVDHDPSELSGGQQQRVAVARALVTSPSLLLADEPTGNLDTRTSMDVMALFQEINADGHGVTVIVVTHEPDIARCARRIIEMRDGRIVRDEPVEDRISAKVAPPGVRPEEAAVGA